jgi:hypothetical protein
VISVTNGGHPVEVVTRSIHDRCHTRFCEKKMKSGKNACHYSIQCYKAVVYFID